jgi:hypothetical protein
VHNGSLQSQNLRKIGSNEFAMLGFMLTTEIQQHTHTGSCDVKSTLAQDTQRSEVLRSFSFSDLLAAGTGPNQVDLLEVT